MLDQILEQDEFPSGVVITFQVMAVSGVSPRDPDPVRAVPEGGQDKLGAHAARTGDPYDPDVGRVLHAADARQIGGAVTAPVAKESRNFRLPITHYPLLSIETG